MRLRELLTRSAASRLDREDGFARGTCAARQFKKARPVFQAFDVKTDGAGGFIVNEIFNEVAQFDIGLIADGCGHAEAGAGVLCMRDQRRHQ